MKKFKPIKIKPVKFRFNFDTDRDGVPDRKDCRPFDYWRQHVDPGDWMDTENPQPTVYGDDWMDTRRYKRTPKRYTPDKFDLEENAAKRYESFSEMLWFCNYILEAYLASLIGIINPEAEPFLRDVTIKHYNDSVIEIYDKNKKVYHFFEVLDFNNFRPNHLISATSKDMRTYGKQNVVNLVL